MLGFTFLCLQVIINILVIKLRCKYIVPVNLDFESLTLCLETYYSERLGSFYDRLTNAAEVLMKGSKSCSRTPNNETVSWKKAPISGDLQKIDFLDEDRRRLLDEDRRRLLAVTVADIWRAVK